MSRLWGILETKKNRLNPLTQLPKICYNIMWIFTKLNQTKKLKKYPKISIKVFNFKKRGIKYRTP